jgi:small subunit ribosomal protein S20
MAHHKSAEKRRRQSLKREKRNKHWKTRVRKAVRQVRASGAPDAEGGPEQFRAAEQLLRKAASKGVMHARTVSRTVSRLHRVAHKGG